MASPVTFFHRGHLDADQRTSTQEAAADTAEHRESRNPLGADFDFADLHPAPSSSPSSPGLHPSAGSRLDGRHGHFRESDQPDLGHRPRRQQLPGRGHALVGRCGKPPGDCRREQSQDHQLRLPAHQIESGRHLLVLGGRLHHVGQVVVELADRHHVSVGSNIRGDRHLTDADRPVVEHRAWRQRLHHLGHRRAECRYILWQDDEQRHGWWAGSG